MKKKTIMLFSFLLVATMVFGACANSGNLSLPEEHDSADLPNVASPGPAPNNNAAIVVMRVNGKDVYKDKFDAAYSSICSQYGLPEDDETYKAILQESAIDLLLSEEALTLKLEELGYMDISDEEMETVKQQAQSELDYVTASSTDTILANLPEDYTEEEYAAAVVAFEDDILKQYNLTRESFLEYFIQNIAIENAKAELLKDAIPSDEEVKAQYENSVEADKEAIGDDLSVYDSYILQGQSSYYIPEGVRYVRHILISFDDELASQIRTARQTDGDEAANELRATALETIQEKADEVLALLQDGDISFTDAIEQYNDDEGMASYTEGYEIFEGCTRYMPEFTQGAMSLNSVGEFTDLVATDYGYHIIEYTSDRDAGPVPFESVEADIYSSLLAATQDSAWAALIEEWKSQLDYTVFDDVL